MRVTLPPLLSFTAGYADTAGFLALKGLFSAHVTGNFVTLGASLVFGTSGATSKVLALPVFCAVIFFTRLLANQLRRAGIPVLRTLLSFEVLLLALCAGVAAWRGPFDDPDSAPALVAGMTLVAALAIQNAAHRVHLSSAPPSTVMTLTTTQIMLDLADVVHGLKPDQRPVTHPRLMRMVTSVLLFAAGCGLSALAYAYIDVWSFCVLVALASATLLLPKELTDASV
jgi:uncharacterized membrane protein YoaK (UPF0700 family)